MAFQMSPGLHQADQRIPSCALVPFLNVPVVQQGIHASQQKVGSVWANQ